MVRADVPRVKQYTYVMLRQFFQVPNRIVSQQKVVQNMQLCHLKNCFMLTVASYT